MNPSPDRDDTDALTGLVDRGGLCRAIDAQLAARDQQAALLVASVDRQLHATPDTLADMAALIAAVAGTDGTAARIGRWDFAALIAVGAADEALLVGEALRRAGSNPAVVRPGVTLSIGLAVATGEGTTHAALMDAARWGRNIARTRGGDLVVAYDATHLRPLLRGIVGGG